ncbi:PREDICTED: odorant receptor 13a-like [Dinoponera quadriceps]|uniref:Odorant receptor n=1 Tax=Dinoponera quadriceps TaxID=609295 RepID=A0A6P3XVJ0_DINQU|nr:PREDICTED: odorant receptor 13a-like [Dinoponera quadriceps]
MDINRVCICLKKADLEYAYGWNRYTMTFMGIWPEDRSFSQVSSYRVLAPVVSMFFFICVPQSINLIFIWGDLDLMLENLSMGNITITISLLKTIVFWSKGGPLRLLMTSMVRDWNTIANKQDRGTMLDIAGISRNLSIKSVMLVQIVVILYIALRFLMIRYSGRQLFFTAYFPYNWTSSPFYELTFMGQLVGTFYAANTYTAVDTFIAMLVLYTCGQLSNLRRELRDLQATTKTEFQGKLRNIVRKHEYLNRFAETIENSFNMMLLLQMLGCSLQMCVQCLQALMSIIGGTDEIFIFQLIFLTVYVTYVLLQLYMYCYIGERLLLESTELIHATYSCCWYNLTAYEAKSLIIIMCRARSPLRISAGGFCSFNRELFSEILKRSVAYMSCIYAVK